MQKQCYLNQKYTTKLLIAFKIAHSCCSSEVHIQENRNFRQQSFITLTIKIMSKFTAKKALQFRSLTVFKNLAQNFVHDVEMAPEGLLDDVNGRVQDHKFKGHRLHSTLVHQGRQGDLKQKH